MGIRKHLRESITAWSSLLDEFADTASKRTISQQFERTKKVSDFIGFLTRLAFLAAIQSFISSEMAESSAIWSWVLAVFGALIFFVQLYFSYSISYIITKFFTRIIPILIDGNKDFIPGFNMKSIIMISIMLILQLFYFIIFSLIAGMMSDRIG